MAMAMVAPHRSPRIIQVHRAQLHKGRIRSPPVEGDVPFQRQGDIGGPGICQRHRHGHVVNGELPTAQSGTALHQIEISEKSPQDIGIEVLEMKKN